MATETLVEGLPDIRDVLARLEAARMPEFLVRVPYRQRDSDPPGKVFVATYRVSARTPEEAKQEGYERFTVEAIQNRLSDPQFPGMLEIREKITVEPYLTDN